MASDVKEQNVVESSIVLCVWGCRNLGEKYYLKGRSKTYFTLKTKSVRNDLITHENLYCKQDQREKFHSGKGVS